MQPDKVTQPQLPDFFPAVSYCELSDKQAHSGLLVEDLNGSICLAHYISQKIKYENFSNSSHQFSYIHHIVKISEDERELLEDLILARVRTICETNKDLLIPFGFTSSLSIFSEIEGKYSPDENISGISCTLFVYSLLSYAGINLLDFDTWPAKGSPHWEIEDERWQQHVFDSLEAISERKELLLKDIGNKRIRPIHLSTATHLYTDTAVTYEQVKENQDFIQTQYDEHVEYMHS